MGWDGGGKLLCGGIYSLTVPTPRFVFGISYVFVPQTIIRYVKSQVFMRSNYLNLLLLHENWRMLRIYRFVIFTTDKRYFFIRGLNEINQVLAKLRPFLRSAFRVPADDCRLSTII